MQKQAIKYGVVMLSSTREGIQCFAGDEVTLYDVSRK